MTRDSDSQPDFLVNWKTSNQETFCNRQNEEVSITTLINNSGEATDSRLRQASASLYTNKTYIEVSDLTWKEPISLTFTPYRVGFSYLVTTTASAVNYGYLGESMDSASRMGNLLFILPGKAIQADISPGRLCTITCSFEQRYAESVLGSLQALSVTQIQKALDMQSSLIANIMLRLLQETTYPGAVSQSIADAYGHAMLVECAHWLTSIEAPNVTGQLTVREFNKMEHYLAGLTGKSPTVADLARVCGLSERYFAKLFRTQTGMTASDYIKTIKITKAKQLLLETNLPLKQIAYQLGYSDSANFSSFFRTATGTTPGLYRGTNKLS